MNLCLHLENFEGRAIGQQQAVLQSTRAENFRGKQMIHRGMGDVCAPPVQKSKDINMPSSSKIIKVMPHVQNCPFPCIDFGLAPQKTTKLPSKARICNLSQRCITWFLIRRTRNKQNIQDFRGKFVINSKKRRKSSRSIKPGL